MLDSRVALYKIFTTIIFLAKQGLALRRHDDKNSNLKQLLMLRCEGVPELKTWINRDNHKWLHNTIVNRIVNLIAHRIRKTILVEITSAKYYLLMIDKTPDIANLE